MLRFSFIILLFFNQKSYAQTTAIKLEDINIIESSVFDNTDTSSIDTLSSDDVDTNIVNSLDDLLRLTPSASTQGGPRSTSESVQVRGLGQNKVFVYIDGAKQKFNSDHSSMLAYDFDDLKKAQIIEGASNFEYAGSISGGAIFTSKDPEDYFIKGQSHGSEFRGGYSDTNHENYYALRTAAKINKKSSALVSVSSRKAGNLNLSDNTSLKYSSFEDFAFKLKYKYRFNKVLTKTTVDLFNRQDFSPQNPTLNPPEDLTSLHGENEINRFTLTQDFEYTNNKFRTQGNIYFTEQDNQKIRKSDKVKENRTISTYGAHSKNTYQFNNTFLTKFGFEITKDYLDGKKDGVELASYPKGEGQEAHVYINPIAKIGRYTITPISARVQNYQIRSNQDSFEKMDKTIVSHGTSINFKNESFDTTLSASQGFNAPKIQEIYPNGLHHEGDGFFIADNFFIPNEDLKHETSNELNFDFKYERAVGDYGLVTLTYNQYWSEVKNYIHLEKTDVPYGFGTGTTQFVNIPKSYLNGRNISAVFLYDQYELSASFSETQGINKTEGIYISTMPANTYNYKAKFYSADNLFDLGVTMTYAQTQNRVNADTIERTEKTPSYTIYGIESSYRIKNKLIDNMLLSFKIDNLFDKEYRKHASNIKEEGRNYKMKMTYQF